jgi:segregation and condensation protein B
MSKRKRAKDGEIPPEETPVEPMASTDEAAVEEIIVAEIAVEEVIVGEFEPLPEAEEAGESLQSLKAVLEAIFFASQKPVSRKELIAIFKGAAEADKENPASSALAFAKVKEPVIQAAIEELEKDCADPSRAYEVRETAAGWQLVTKPDFAPWLRQLYPENRPAKLSSPALETLAIIAYRQPITRADIEAVRGVAVDGVMQTLLDRGLVKIAGRAEIPGRPLLYETTQNFMEHFGLKDLDDLPNASELRKIDLPKAEIPVETPAEQPELAAAEAAAPEEPGAPDQPALPVEPEVSEEPVNVESEN